MSIPNNKSKTSLTTSNPHLNSNNKITISPSSTNGTFLSHSLSSSLQLYRQFWTSSLSTRKNPPRNLKRNVLSQLHSSMRNKLRLWGIRWSRRRGIGLYRKGKKARFIRGQRIRWHRSMRNKRVLGKLRSVNALYIDWPWSIQSCRYTIWRKYY